MFSVSRQDSRCFISHLDDSVVERRIREVTC
jgi:hypothetical protein